MGVSGSGKSTVGWALAEAFGWRFIEGDDLHPQSNVNKMASGKPLSDADRLPWLANLRHEIDLHVDQGRRVVVSCSALKQGFRDRLIEGFPRSRFIYLRGDYELILGRMQSRVDHFMQPNLLRSQFDSLEVPKDAIVIDVSLPVDQIVKEVSRELATPPES